MAINGIGADLQKDTGSGTYESVAEVVDIQGPNMSRNTIDTSHLQVTSGYSTFIGGLRDPGQVTFTINYDRAGYEDLKSDFESDTLQSYAILIPDDDNTALMFDGLVTELPLSIPTNDRITGSVTLQVSGSVTVSSGTS
jgi:predicted secreted protein